MADQNDFQPYNIHENEELIVKAMDYLKYVDPNNASREDAISLLEFMQTTAKEVAKHVSIDSFDEYYKEYKKQRLA